MVEFMVLTLLDNYPRAMGHPQQDVVVYDKEQRDEYINRYIKHCDLYMSVYRFNTIRDDGNPDRESAYIDKVFLDFDSDNWLEDIIKVHNWCKQYDIVHRFHFSGRGAHGFIFVKPSVTNKKEAVGNFQRWIMQELNLQIDPKIIGDIARIFRFPNTFNFAARRFCIALPSHLLDENKSVDYILRLATKRQFFNAWCGSKLLDLSQWDTNENLYVSEPEANFTLNEVDPAIQTQYAEFPPCMQKLMSTPVIDDALKFTLVIFLKEQTLTAAPFDSKEIISILKKIWNPQEFDHYFGNGKGVLKRRHAGHHGIKFKTAMTKDYFMPNCTELRSNKLCPADCDRRNPAYN